MAANLVRRSQEGLWILLVLLLPFTSLPFMASVAGLSMVAPPSFIPLVLLGGLWWLPAILRGRKLPASAVPILVFALLAILSAAASNFITIPPFRESNNLANSIEALVTLGVGIAVFLVAATWPDTRDNLRFLFRWINMTGLAIIIWSLIQAAFWYTQNSYPEWAYTLQSWFSTSGNLYYQRPTGFAYEPSWLAHQLNMLFLPYWLAATIQKTSAHRSRLLFFTIENALLIGGVAVLFLSLSRVGWLAFLLAAGYLFLQFNIGLIKYLRKRVLTRVNDARIKKIASWTLPIGMVLLLLILYLGLFLGAGFVLSRIDYRMAKLFSPNILEQGGFTEIANQLVFAERVVFWNTGLEIFNDYPILGVGPGHAGFFFPEKMVPFGWGLTEVSTIMYQMATIPNTKSLWVRLLAENGIIGFGIFVSWLYVLWFSSHAIKKSEEPFTRAIGWMGSFVLVAFLIEGFSVDTFALPYYWLSFGLLVAAYRIARQKHG